MSRRNQILMGAMGLGAAISVCFLASPGLAGPLYSWQNEQGAMAFSDDLAKVPARFRDEVATRDLPGLHDYERLTRQDHAAMGRYQGALNDRLTSLRQRAARPEPARAAERRRPSQVLSLRTGGPDAPSIELETGSGSSEPLIVETVTTRPADRLTTRRSLVVRQGDRTLALVRPRLHEWNVAEDIHIEGDGRF